MACTDKSFSMVFYIFHGSKNLLRYVKNGFPSNWCQHWYPWHWARRSRAFMQSMIFAAQSWALMLLLTCGRCSVDFFGLSSLLFDVFDTIEHDWWLFDVVVVITIKWGDQGISCKELYLWLSLEQECCYLFAEGIVLIFWFRFIVVSCFWCHWTWSLIVWCCCCCHGFHAKSMIFAAQSWALM